MLLATAGFLSGILSGMGVGGGMILIPVLTIFAGASQHTAQTVNLYYFIPSAAAALVVHIKNKNIETKAALPMIICGAPFAALGAYLAVRLSPRILGKLFAAFIFVFGCGEIFKSVKLFKKQ